MDKRKKKSTETRRTLLLVTAQRPKPSSSHR